MLLDYGTRFRRLVAGKIRGNGSETLDFISIWCLREGHWPLDLACLPLFFFLFFSTEFSRNPNRWLGFHRLLLFPSLACIDF